MICLVRKKIIIIHVFFADDSEEEQSLQANRSEAVKEALRVFEENITTYAKNPAAVLTLCDKLNDKDQQQFLNILFRQYTPDKIDAKIKEKQRAMEKAMTSTPVAAALPPVDSHLVAHVFKEVFTHFRVYKKNPQKFKPLTDRLNSEEQKAFEALVKAFWDVTADKIKL